MYSLCRRLTISSFVIIVLLFENLVCWGAEVDWRLKSCPAVFGNTTTLICNVTDDDITCSSKRLQWIGSINYGILCTEFQCKNSTKYEVQKPEACTYILKIHSFSEYDVNCDYTCSYGVINRRKTLEINNKDFMYIPKKGEITKSKPVVKTNISLIINIERIFPEPSCYTKFKDNEMVAARTNTTRSGTFFKSEIDVNCTLPSCSTELKIVCKFGNRHMEIASEKIDICKDQKRNKMIIYAVAASATTLIGSVILCLIIYKVWICRRPKKKDFTEEQHPGRELVKNVKLQHERLKVSGEHQVPENDKSSKTITPVSSATPLLDHDKVEGIPQV